MNRKNITFFLLFLLMGFIPFGLAFIVETFVPGCNAGAVTNMREWTECILWDVGKSKRSVFEVFGNNFLTTFLPLIVTGIAFIRLRKIKEFPPESLKKWCNLIIIIVVLFFSDFFLMGFINECLRIYYYYPYLDSLPEVERDIIKFIEELDAKMSTLTYIAARVTFFLYWCIFPAIAIFTEKAPLVKFFVDPFRIKKTK